jgi:hypothetical protein
MPGRGNASLGEPLGRQCHLVEQKIHSAASASGSC